MTNQTVKLNDTEKMVLAAVVKQIEDCTGCQFGFVSDVETPFISDAQRSGYFSQLQRKGLIQIFEETPKTHNQVLMTQAGCVMAGENPEDFECAD